MSALKQKVLVVGAYGLIGSGIARRLIRDGHQLVGLGRNADTGKRALPDLNWHSADLRDLTTPAAWYPILDGITAVVNCSGALQDGPEDDLEALHHHAIAALALACKGIDSKLIQISAVGAFETAPNEFLASKARGDLAIQASGVHHCIFRPGLVLAPQSYGGTTLLRMLAAIPVIQPIAIAKSQIQTVSLADVAAAVSASIDGKIPDGTVVDLVEAQAHSLGNVVAQIRHWLGFKPAHLAIEVPRSVMTFVSKTADGLAWLGWKTPLRSTAVDVLTEGVRGEPAELSQFGVAPCAPLSKTLASMPVGSQDRLFARMMLLTPIILFSLCFFWLASGIIGLARAQAAASVLETAGWPHGLSIASVVFWGIVDIAIGIGFALRKWAVPACWAAVGVSLFYLFASTIAVPSLWIDPLGPLIKVIPALVLALVARIALETR